jgi:hypothetical protein
MATVQVDIEEGYSASHDLLSGWDYTRVGLVDELPVGLSTDDLITQAEAIMISVVGDRGTKYQMGSSGIFVYLKAFVPEIRSPNCVMFRIVYHGYPLLQYEFDAALTQIESNVDTNSTPIATSYKYPTHYSDTAKAGHRFVQGAMVARDENEPVFSVTFMVVRGSITVFIRGKQFMLFNANATDMMTVIGAFGGTCNNDVYTIGQITGTKHQWKIVKVSSTSPDQGLTYYAKMYFQFRHVGWDKTVTFIDPGTGQPPPDLILSTVKVTDNTFPQYAGIPPVGADQIVIDSGTPDIGSTIAFTVSESKFPSFGDVQNATFPIVAN